MTPNKQVSPAIRILRGERDASARATHLEAATRKYLVTTIERKQMSTKTNFKRIALVAVAALGLGVLSSVPSQAAFSGTAGSQLTITVANGTGSLSGSRSDSTTAGTVSVTGLALLQNDSYTITAIPKTRPTGSTVSPNLLFTLIDTATSTSAVTVKGVSGVVNFTAEMNKSSDTATTVSAANTANSAAYVTAKFFAFQESLTPTNDTRVAGTYVYTVIVTPKQAAVGDGTPQTTDISITIGALASAGNTASAGSSGATIASGAGSLPSTFTLGQVDSTLAVAATASASASAVVRVYLKNDAGGTGIKDSLTVTLDKGTFGTSGAGSKSAVIAYDQSATGANPYLDISLYPDGTTGTGTLSIVTKNAGTFTKTITWVSTTPASITNALRTSVISVGSTSGVVRGQELDAGSNNFGLTTSLFAYSSDTSVISNYGTACAAPALDSGQYYSSCSLTGVKAGTATITLRDASTIAASTAGVVSNGVSVRVSTGVATSVKLTTDKSSYAPGEKGYLIITVNDAAGLVMPAGTYANLFDSRGIQVSSGVSAASTLISSIDTITGKITYNSDVFAKSSWTTARSSATSIAPSSSDPIAFVLFYAPTAAGSFTFTATGDTSLPAANRVAVTATATVADSASAALAAVSALAVTVASLKTLITTLTNLVLKIQKKVKA